MIFVKRTLRNKALGKTRGQTAPCRHRESSPPRHGSLSSCQKYPRVCHWFRHRFETQTARRRSAPCTVSARTDASLASDRGRGVRQRLGRRGTHPGDAQARQMPAGAWLYPSETPRWRRPGGPAAAKYEIPMTAPPGRGADTAPSPAVPSPGKPLWVVLRWAGLVALSTLFTAGFEILHLPAALLLGPMFAAIALAIGGAGLSLPISAMTFSQGILGFLVASLLPPAILGELAAALAAHRRRHALDRRDLGRAWAGGWRAPGFCRERRRSGARRPGLPR